MKLRGSLIEPFKYLIYYITDKRSNLFPLWKTRKFFSLLLFSSYRFRCSGLSLPGQRILHTVKNLVENSYFFSKQFCCSLCSFSSSNQLFLQATSPYFWSLLYSTSSTSSARVVSLGGLLLVFWCRSWILICKLQKYEFLFLLIFQGENILHFIQVWT